MTTNDTQQMRDFVEAAIANLIQIEGNLLKLGYKFANEQGAIKRIPPNTNSGLAELKHEYEQLPDFFVAWYDRIEFVDFSQHEGQLIEPSENPIAGLGLNCTMVFGSLSTRRERQTTLEATGFQCKTADGNVFVPLGTYASNSMPKGLWLPDNSRDPIIYDAGAGPVSMIEEITRAIRAGGFPFWEVMFTKRRISSPIPNTPRYRDILPALLEGVVAM
ncbi:MAG: hypothetical protein ACK5OB_11460 [Pirellula sp.]